MKRIFTTLALASTFAIGAQAQTQIDFSVAITGTSGPVISCESGDSVAMNMRVANNGPGSLMAGDTLALVGPWSDLTSAIPYKLPSNFNPGDTVRLGIKLASSEFQTLFDPETTVDSIVPAPFTVGRKYAVYFGIVRFASSPYTDSVSNNNYDAVYAYWCDSTLGIFNPSLDRTNISVYPNPTSDVINFEYNFDNTSAATVRVIDMLGRTVVNRDFGTQSVGNNKFTLDVANLPNGMYTMELITDDKRAVSKFNVNR